MRIFKRPVFISVVIFKFLLSYLFSSQYNLDLFIPFVSSLSLDNWNPWQTYYENGIFDAFKGSKLNFIIALIILLTISNVCAILSNTFARVWVE